MRKASIKIAKGLAGLVMMVNLMSVSTACWWHFHQPEMPEALKKMRKA